MAMLARLEIARLQRLILVLGQFLCLVAQQLTICKLLFIYVEDHTYLLGENMFSKAWQLQNLKPSRQL